MGAARAFAKWECRVCGPDLRLRLRRVVGRQGGDDLDRFDADANDLPDEADDVIRAAACGGGACALRYAL